MNEGMISKNCYMGPYSYMGCLTTQLEEVPIIASWVAQPEINFTSVAQLAICICKFHFFYWINGLIKNREIKEQNC